jgi:hypothetical protein
MNRVGCVVVVVVVVVVGGGGGGVLVFLASVCLCTGELNAEAAVLSMTQW